MRTIGVSLLILCIVLTSGAQGVDYNDDVLSCTADDRADIVKVFEESPFVDLYLDTMHGVFSTDYIVPVELFTDVVAMRTEWTENIVPHLPDCAVALRFRDAGNQLVHDTSFFVTSLVYNITSGDNNHNVYVQGVFENIKVVSREFIAIANYLGMPLTTKDLAGRI